jgi:hypothetical protein
MHEWEGLATARRRRGRTEVAGPPLSTTGASSVRVSIPGDELPGRSAALHGPRSLSLERGLPGASGHRTRRSASCRTQGRSRPRWARRRLRTSRPAVRHSGYGQRELFVICRAVTRDRDLGRHPPPQGRRLSQSTTLAARTAILAPRPSSATVTTASRSRRADHVPGSPQLFLHWGLHQARSTSARSGRTHRGVARLRRVRREDETVRHVGLQARGDVAGMRRPQVWAGMVMRRFDAS